MKTMVTFLFPIMFLGVVCAHAESLVEIENGEVVIYDKTLPLHTGVSVDASATKYPDAVEQVYLGPDKSVTVKVTDIGEVTGIFHTEVIAQRVTSVRFNPANNIIAAATTERVVEGGSKQILYYPIFWVLAIGLAYYLNNTAHKGMVWLSVGTFCLLTLGSVVYQPIPPSSIAVVILGLILATILAVVIASSRADSKREHSSLLPIFYISTIGSAVSLYYPLIT